MWQGLNKNQGLFCDHSSKGILILICTKPVYKNLSNEEYEYLTPYKFVL
jgi:hypothetical protein